MLFAVFETEKDALETERQIFQNLVNWHNDQIADKELVSQNKKLLSRSALTREVNQTMTLRWAIPKQRLDGKWVFEWPVDQKTYPVPAKEIVKNINVMLEKYTIDWFETDK